MKFEGYGWNGSQVIEQKQFSSICDTVNFKDILLPKMENHPIKFEGCESKETLVIEGKQFSHQRLLWPFVLLTGSTYVTG